MEITARIVNERGAHTVELQTGAQAHSLVVPPKPEGSGSSVNGGELLFLALATCYCNDIYREANKRGIQVKRVQVEVTGSFGAEGEGARDIRYRASVDAHATQPEILELMTHTDTVSEIQNTLRRASPVVLSECEARQV